MSLKKLGKIPFSIEESSMVMISSSVVVSKNVVITIPTSYFI